MCGIAGFVASEGYHDQVPTLLQQMAGKLAHRGPDDEGYLLWDAGLNVQHARGNDTVRELADLPRIESLAGNRYAGGFGYRRLSIFDTSAAGHQPMSTPDGKLHIIFNGAIYNWPDLRRQLEQAGYQFRTRTDTEVLLYAYRHWGEAMMSQLEGMWAFAILDLENHCLFGSRDRFGVKPIYFLMDRNGFAFASEQKALYSLPFCDHRVSRTAAFEFLIMGDHARRQTGLVKAVQEILPGDAFQLNLETFALKQWQYYKLPVSYKWESYKDSHFKRHREKVRELLAESVLLRLKADVPLGACLSGGLDSSGLVGLATAFRKEMNGKSEPMKVFTASFPGFWRDETDFAAQTVAGSGATWIKVMPTAQELQRDLRDFFITHDLPLQTIGTYAQYRVMQAAKEAGVTITLDGQGADEVFGGYAQHFLAFYRELYRKGQYGLLIQNFWSANSNFASKGGIIRDAMKAYMISWMGRKSLEVAYRRRHEEHSLYRNGFWENHSKYLEEQAGNLSFSLNDTLYRHMTGPLLGTHLRMADRNSMRFGVESRLPYTDAHKLVEYMFAVPPVYKIKKASNKAILRSALRGIVPRPILDRREKVGFQAPEKEWMKELKDIFRDYLTHDMDEYINVKALQTNYDRYFDLAMSTDPARFWRIISMAIWRKEVMGKW